MMTDRPAGTTVCATAAGSSGLARRSGGVRPGHRGQPAGRAGGDLPGGGERLVRGRGVDHVLVAGDEVVADGGVTGARPGRVLRSGATPRRCRWPASGGSRPVDDQGGPTDGAGIVRGQVGDCGGHLGRVDDPAHR